MKMITLCCTITTHLQTISTSVYMLYTELFYIPILLSYTFSTEFLTVLRTKPLGPT
jgi:hypothetical protein